MSKIEKEVEFFKDIFGKTFTVFLLVATGTVTHYSQKGIDGLTAAGWIGSVILFTSVLFTGYLYKREINELED